MDRKFILPLLCSVLLTGCHFFANTTVVEGPDTAQTKLAESATSISNSISDLAGIQRVTNTRIISRPLPGPTNYDMNGLVSVDWDGPIGPLVEKLGLLSGYRVRVLGDAPAIPVIVSVTAKDTPLAYILRDADFQGGSRANIIVLPAYRIIELRYARGG